MTNDPDTKASSHTQSYEVDTPKQPAPAGESKVPNTQTAAPKNIPQKLVETGRRLIHMHGGPRNLLAYGVRVVRDEGLTGFMKRLRRVAASGTGFGQTSQRDYQKWIAQYDTLTPAIRDAMRKRTSAWTHRPLLSVVVSVRDGDLQNLREMIRSVQEQIYPNWELCIAANADSAEQVRALLDGESKRDARIKVVVHTEDRAGWEVDNSALELAHGDFVVLLDEQDVLPEHALFMVAQTIDRYPHGRIFYSDEDQLSADRKRTAPHFKSDWNPELFLALDACSHLAVYDTALIREMGGFRPGFEDCRYHDLALRGVERAGNASVIHIAHVLCHRRSPSADSIAPPSLKRSGEQMARAVAEHLERRGVEATVSLTSDSPAVLQVRYAIPNHAPRVSLLIPTRDGLALLRQCIDSVLEKTTYPNYEILVIDNGSELPETLEYFEKISELPNVRVLRDDSPFNFSALNNRAAAQASGEYLCLLNNDTEVISPDWLDEMVGLACQPGNGAIGAALWYPNDRLQHGGVLIGLGGVGGHVHHMLAKGDAGYFNRALVTQNLSAVTAACLVIRKAIYDEVGGLDEALQVAFNDVDFCLRVREAGYRNVWTPHAELYHYESATRGSDMAPEKYRRFSNEVRLMEQRWKGQLENDPAYNPNLSLSTQVLPFSLAEPPRAQLPD
ncbi:glycosyltransferase family 2 protein [Paraburkholderia bannensis]|uniref:glycosyltransferase family 2 protein n=1 Tax=Paraburkholderia bannensis TaxID=765414 RepID=UPI002ABE4342|nr:glycosyltransferase family 2 protein [Paraburkholderia bannensis]